MNLLASMQYYGESGSLSCPGATSHFWGRVVATGASHTRPHHLDSGILGPCSAVQFRLQ